MNYESDASHMTSRGWSAVSVCSQKSVLSGCIVPSSGAAVKMPVYLWTPKKARLLSATDSAQKKMQLLLQFCLGFLQPNITLQQLVTSSWDLTGTQ